MQDSRGYTAKVIANGTATANAAFTVTFNQDKTYPAGCILTGCPQGGAQSTYYIGVFAFGTGNLITADYGYGSVFSTDMPDRITIYIKSGQTVNNLVFEPMIRDPNTNDVFQPYFTGESPVGINGISVKSNATGKNLFNVNGAINAFYQSNGDKENFTSAGKNELSDGKIVAYRNFDSQKLVGQFINVKAGEVYTISAIATGFESPTRGAISIAEWYNGAFVQEALYLPTAGARAYKSYRAKTDTLCIGFGSSGQSSGVTFDQIQLDKGWVPTEYEQYKTFSSDLTITTALPLRGSYKTIDLGDYDWWYQTSVEAGDPASVPRFATTGKIFDAYIPSVEFGVTMSSCSSRYTPAVDPVFGGNTDKTICFGKGKSIYVVDNAYTDPAEFKAAVTGITLTYPSYCDEIDLADGVAIKRLDSNGDALATPVTTPLSDAEKAAFAAFRTFEGATNLAVTDDPFISMTYVKNSSNGKALANVDNRIKETDISGKVDKVPGKGLSTEDYTTAEKTKLASLSPITISSTLTLTVAGWDSQTKQQTVLTTIDTTKRNVVDITVEELPTWSECNVYAISESATGVTFQCDTIPEDALTFKITSMVVTSNA